MILAYAMYSYRVETLNGTHEVRLHASASDERMTDVYLWQSKSGSEEKILTISDAFRDHYHPAESWGEYTFIIKRPGGVEAALTNPNWTDELWLYARSGEGKKLYSTKGLDFRVSPQAGKIIVFSQEDRNIVIMNLEGDVQKILVQAELQGLKKEDVLHPMIWDGNEFWFVSVQGALVSTVFELDTTTFAVVSHDVSDLQASLRDFVIIPSSKMIEYTRLQSSERLRSEIR